MLLPSDIARLVLGYLQQEGLRATSQAFILESPNLKEYAEHSTEDGVIPACVFSLFGKNLATILNEYVAVKAKEMSQETPIPAMMTSLWKKLDFTLNQIKCMQNSPAVYQNQRFRTRNGIMNSRRPRALSSTQSPNSELLPASSPGHSVPSPVATPQGMLGHSTPLCYAPQQTRPSPLCGSQHPSHDGGRMIININRESPLQILVPDHRFNPGPLSPGRRKCDSPRRRGGSLSALSGTGRANATSSSLTVEPPSEDAVSESFPQMVIENAREKILNNRSLQEKLAENINKILASDNSPQTSKAACSTVEPDHSIDEILGLQGEIHMSDDAIHDILEQTESDPAFQALFDLFDYGKTNEVSDQGDGNISNSTQESEETGRVDSSSETGDPGTGHEDSPPEGETSSRKLRTRNVQEAKSKRKSAAPLQSTSKSTPSRPGSEPGVVVRGSAHSRKVTSRNRSPAGNDRQTRVAASSLQEQLNKAADSQLPEKDVSVSSLSEEVAGMDVDEPLDALTSERQDLPIVLQPVRQESPQAAKGLRERSPQVSACDRKTFETSPSPAATASASAARNAAESEKEAGMADRQVAHRPEPLSAPVHAGSLPPLLDACMQDKEGSLKESQSYTSTSAPEALPALTAASAVTSVPSASPSFSNPHGNEPDPSKIVSLKIIISDEQDERSNDAALSQAVSSITGDRIPTIFLSSPGKSPAKGLAAASSSMTQEETVLAVSSLQTTEVMGTLALGIQDNIQLSHAGVGELTQETGYIQLVPATSIFGGSGSYILVTDPAAVDHQSNVVVIPSTAPQGLMTATSHVVATPPHPRTVISMSPDVSQTYSPGSTIIISSSVPPMLQSVVVPVSVVGQNNAGKFTVVPNQMLALPSPTSVKHLAKIKAKPKLAPKDTNSGKMGISGSKVIQVSKVALPLSFLSTDQCRSSVGSSPPSHRRMLCFDASTDEANTSQSPKQARETSSSSKLPEVAALTSSPGQQIHKDNAKAGLTQPIILGCTRVQRRIETVRLAGKTDTSGMRESEKPSSHQQQKESTKNTQLENDTDRNSKSNSTSKADAALQESSTRSESRRKSQTSYKEDGVLQESSTRSECRRKSQTSDKEDGVLQESNTRSESRRKSQTSDKEDAALQESSTGSESRRKSQTSDKEDAILQESSTGSESRRKSQTSDKEDGVLQESSTGSESRRKSQTSDKEDAALQESSTRSESRRKSQTSDKEDAILQESSTGSESRRKSQTSDKEDAVLQESSTGSESRRKSQTSDKEDATLQESSTRSESRRKSQTSDKEDAILQESSTGSESRRKSQTSDKEDAALQESSTRSESRRKSQTSDKEDAILQESSTGSESRRKSQTSDKEDGVLQESSTRSESRRKSQTSDKEDGRAGSKDIGQSMKSTSVGHRLRSKSPGVKKDTKDTTRPEPCEKVPVKVQEGCTEKIQEPPHVTANKENEVEGSRREEHQTPPPPPEDFSVSAVARSPISQSGSGKTLSKTSPLTKQAVEMLQDIQGQNPTSTPPRRHGAGCLELPLPRTPRIQEDSLDGLITPTRLRQGRERDGTPRHLAPPATPDIPSCSPASEAGSENSINMAAHTLMILSRAARTGGGPLKDRLRQEEVGGVKSADNKGKKRKHAEPSPPTKKELQLLGSSGSKKAKKQKRLLDSFPDDLDVDKFLSSLHYDE